MSENKRIECLRSFLLVLADPPREINEISQLSERKRRRIENHHIDDYDVRDYASVKYAFKGKHL